MPTNVEAPAIPAELEKLTPKQRDFVLAYIETKNGTEAARRAGYKGNDKTLGQVGYENMAKPEIKAAIDAIMRPVLDKQLLTIERIMAEYADIAFADWREFVQLSRREDNEILEAKLMLKDKLTAMRAVGDHVGAFKLAGDQGNAPRFQFAVNMTEDEARTMLNSLLKK